MSARIVSSYYTDMGAILFMLIYLVDGLLVVGAIPSSMIHKA